MLWRSSRNWLLAQTQSKQTALDWLVLQQLLQLVWQQRPVFSPPVWPQAWWPVLLLLVSLLPFWPQRVWLPALPMQFWLQRQALQQQFWLQWQALREQFSLRWQALQQQCWLPV